MPIAVKISTITNDEDETQTGVSLDMDLYTLTEFQQFYVELKAIVRDIELIFDEKRLKEDQKDE